MVAIQPSMTGSAAAQVAPLPDVTPIERERERQQHEEQVREVERQLEDVEARDASGLLPSRVLPGGMDMPAVASVEVRDIIVEQGDDGVRLDFSEVVRPYEGRMFDNAALFELVRDASKLLHDAGYVTSVVSVRPQNLRSGTLILHINWGRIKGWLIDGSPATRARQRRMLAAALPLVERRLLNIQDIDQIVENMNTPGKSVQVRIVAAEEEGASYLDIQLHRPRDPSVTFNINGGGRVPFDEGRDIVSGVWRIGDLAGINDVLTLDAATRYYDGIKDNNYLKAGLQYDVPIGYSKLGINYSYSRYEHEISGQYGSYSSNGDLHIVQVNGEVILYRKRANKWSIYGHVSHEIVRNFIEGRRIDINSKNYSAFRLGVRHSAPYLGGFFFADLGLEVGLGVYDGARAAFNDRGEPRHYRRVQLNTGWSTNFKLATVPLNYVARAGLQYSDRQLLDRYRFAIGDDFTVRGFENTPLRGDVGGYISATLSSSIPFGDEALVLTPFVGLDAGGIRSRGADSQSRYIAAAAAGARVNWGLAHVSVTYGHPLLISGGLVSGLVRRGLWRFQAGYSF